MQRPQYRSNANWETQVSHHTKRKYVDGGGKIKSYGNWKREEREALEGEREVGEFSVTEVDSGQWLLYYQKQGPHPPQNSHPIKNRKITCHNPQNI